MQTVKHSPQPKKNCHTINASGSSVEEGKSIAQRVMDVSLIASPINQADKSDPCLIGANLDTDGVLSNDEENIANKIADVRTSLKSPEEYDSIQADDYEQNNQIVPMKDTKNNSNTDRETSGLPPAPDRIVLSLGECEGEEQQVACSSSQADDSTKSISNSSTNIHHITTGTNSPQSPLLETTIDKAHLTNNLQIKSTPTTTSDKIISQVKSSSTISRDGTEIFCVESQRNNLIGKQPSSSICGRAQITQSSRTINSNLPRTEQLVSQPIFKQNMKPNDNSDELSVIRSKQVNLKNESSQRNLPTITLDTQVPHPTQALRNNGFHSEEEEVSYLNLGVHNNRGACSSLDNTTKPILLAAAKEQRFGLQPKTAASFQHLQPTSPRQPRPFNARRQSNTSAHEYEGMGSEYDEYDAHYGNALVEKRIRLNELEDEQRKAKMATKNSSRNNIIESLYDCTNGCSNSSNQQRRTHGNSTSVPASPKAKSAPATPCNITPTAFHQHNPDSMVTTRGATIGGQVHLHNHGSNKDARRVLLSRTNETDQFSINLKDLNELVKRGEVALKKEDHEEAIKAFGHCIDLATKAQDYTFLKKNYKIYGLRAEAHLKMGNYREAIDDSMAARELNSKWTQAYYLQGRAQLLIGEYIDSLAVFSYGLAQDPSNTNLFSALIDAALQSSCKQDFEPKLEKLRSLGLEKKPFVVVSLLGQELLARNLNKHAAIILESALKLESSSLCSSEDRKFKGSVLSSIAYAYCMLKDLDKALVYMQRELEIENELEDVAGQCRVLSNLGFTFYKIRKFDKSLEAHRKQLNLAMKSDLYHQASLALNAIGHVHMARNDFQNALTSHTRCLDIMRQLSDNDVAQFRELLSIGYVYSMMNDFKLADERYREAEQFLASKQNKFNRSDFTTCLVMLRFNMGHLSLKKQSFREAKEYYHEVVHHSRELAKTDSKLGTLYEMRASNGIGHTFRLSKRFDDARGFFKKQLQLAQNVGDVSGQSQALCNLGMTCQHFKEYTQARRYFEENLRLVEKKPLLKAYAHSYMASIQFLLGHYSEAQNHYVISLGMFKELDYCTSEKKTIELNMAFVHERIGHQDLAHISSQIEAPPANAEPAVVSTKIATTTPTSHQKRVMMAS